MRRRDLWFSMLGGNRWTDVVAPDAAFNYVPFEIQKKGRKIRVADGWDVSSLAPTGKAYYVSTTGNNSNNGLSWATAYRSIWQAANQSDCVVIYIAAGQYNYDNNLRGADAYFRSMIGVGGQVVITNDIGLTGWVLDGNHYTKASVSDAIGTVLDTAVLDVNGNYSFYALKTSAAEVDATPGSWYKDGSNTVHVRTLDGRAPDSALRVNRNTGVISPQADNRTYYFENITFEPGPGTLSRFIWLRVVTSAGGSKFLAKNCKFMYSLSLYNIIDSDGVDVILQGCETGVCPFNDALNYTPADGVTQSVIEIDCVSHDCGEDGNDQASTSHNGIPIVRINGKYYRTTGQALADVGAAPARSWNLGCEMHDCTDGFYLGNSGSKAWLDSCRIYNTSGFDINTEVGATVNIRGLISDGNYGGAGTVQPY